MSHVQTPTLHIQLQHYTLKTCLGPVLLLHLYITTHILHCIISPQLHIAICVCQRNHREGINRLTFFFFNFGGIFSKIPKLLLKFRKHRMPWSRASTQQSTRSSPWVRLVPPNVTSCKRLTAEVLPFASQTQKGGQILHVSHKSV